MAIKYIEIPMEFRPWPWYGIALHGHGRVGGFNIRLSTYSRLPGSFIMAEFAWKVFLEAIKSAINGKGGRAS